MIHRCAILVCVAFFPAFAHTLRSTGTFRGTVSGSYFFTLSTAGISAGSL